MLRARLTVGAFAVWLAVPALLLPPQVAAQPAPRAMFTIPAQNVGGSAPILDDRHIVYGIPLPRFHRPVCVSCGQRPFTSFHVQVFIRDYATGPSGTTVSPPRLLFQASRGWQVILFSIAGGWLVYATARADSNTWYLWTRSLTTGRTILLDSSRRGVQVFSFTRASSDGRTVVWQSGARIDGKVASVIRSLDLTTGRRQILAASELRTDTKTGLANGAGNLLSGPAVSANRVVFVSSPVDSHDSRIELENLTTRHVRALTPPGQWNDEPFISGNVTAWVHGRIGLGYTHGLVVMNLATGRRAALKRSSSQLPQVAAGRYVVFGLDYLTRYPKGIVEAYDAVTGRRRTIVSGPDAAGFIPNPLIQAGGRTALVGESKPCAPANGVCPNRFVLVPLEP